MAVRIVVDTSALHGDMPLERPDARALLAASKKGEIELVVPEIVVLEAVNLFRERLEQARKAVATARREAAALGVDAAIELPATEAAAAAYEEKLRRELDEANVRVPGPPPADHLDIIRRAIEKRKPFDPKGRGYRDTLIWFQVVEEAREGDVILVTANVKDFAADDRSTLAPELADDLEAAGLSRDKVAIAQNLVSVAREYLEESAVAAARLQHLLGHAAFRQQLERAITESLQYKEIPAPEDDDLRILDVSEIEVLIHEVRDLEIDDAYDPGGNVITFTVVGTLDAEAHFYPLKSEIVSSDVPEVAVLDWDWNEWVVLASKMLELSFEGFGAYDTEEERITAVDIWTN